MSDADRAYEAAEREIAKAEREIAKAKAQGHHRWFKSLSFEKLEFRVLERLPPQIAELTNLRTLVLDNTRIDDLAPLAGLTGMHDLSLNNTRITDLSPLAGMSELQTLTLNNTRITDLTPLAGMTSLQSLYLDNTPIADITPLAGMKELRTLDLDNTHVADLSPLAKILGLETLHLSKSGALDLRPLLSLGSLDSHNIFARGLYVLSFADTPSTKHDKRLSELAAIKSKIERTRETLAYLRTLPPWPEPYTPAATPDGSPPQAIGDKALEQARTLSDLTPLAEELLQNPDTGTFTARPKPIEKPDLLSGTLGIVADAIEDVLLNPNNGLNAASLDIRKLRRTIERYGNDPQRIEMDFTTAHGSITRLIAVDELPPSDENLALLTALEEGAMGIRATDTAVAVNRRILQEQKLREMSAQDIAKIAEAAPVLEAITEGDTQQQMHEDVPALVEELTARRPTLPGVTRADAILPARDEAVRVFGRSARMTIMLRKSPDMLKKIEQSSGYKAASIMAVLKSLVDIGLGLFNIFKG